MAFVFCLALPSIQQNVETIFNIVNKSISKYNSNIEQDINLYYKNYEEVKNDMDDGNYIIVEYYDTPTACFKYKVAKLVRELSVSECFPPRRYPLFLTTSLIKGSACQYSPDSCRKLPRILCSFIRVRSSLSSSSCSATLSNSSLAFSNPTCLQHISGSTKVSYCSIIPEKKGISVIA